MRSRFRMLAAALAAFSVLVVVVSFAPEPIPAVPPPVRLEGSIETTTDPLQNELVVVPAPSVDLGSETPFAVTPTTSTPAPPPTVGTAPTPVEDDQGQVQGDAAVDSAASADASADSPDG